MIGLSEIQVSPASPISVDESKLTSCSQQLFLADSSKFTKTISNARNIPRVKVTQYKARHARDFSASGEDFGGDELIADAGFVRRSAGQDLVEEELFE